MSVKQLLERPLSHVPDPIGVGQWDKQSNTGTSPGTYLGQGSLKALVGKASNRDSAWDNNRTGGDQSCPTEGGSGTRKSDPVPVMPKTSEPLVSGDEIAERAAITEFDAWAMGFARLQAMTPPASIPEPRWLQVLNDTALFPGRLFAKQVSPDSLHTWTAPERYQLKAIFWQRIGSDDFPHVPRKVFFLP